MDIVSLGQLKKLHARIDNLMADRATEYNEDVILTPGNTELLVGQIYKTTGGLQVDARFNTLYFPVGKYTSFLLNNYPLGVYGGAFVKQDKTWISSFQTDSTNATIRKDVPKDAYYIAISVNVNDMYKKITCYYNTYSKQLDPEQIADAIPVGKVYSEAITLSTNNTELLVGQIYRSDGGFQTIASYNTLYFPVGKYNAFLLSNYMVGVYGGAFVKQDKTWISSFQTDSTNASVVKNVPAGAYYIAISVDVNNMYKSITGYYTDYSASYKLSKLLVDSSQIVGAPLQGTGVAANNQWAGKKIVWLGTSVPFGQNATKSYAQEAANKLGFNLVQTSMPGQAIHMATTTTATTYGSTSMSKAEYLAEGRITIESAPIAYTPGGSYNDYYRTWENIFVPANSDADLWVFDVVPNNTNFATTDWDAFDRGNWKYNDNSTFDTHRLTFTGALLFLMDKMYALNPNARMVFVLGSAFAYSSGKTVFDTMKSTWNIPTIDIWGKINTSPKSLLQIKSLGGTDSHPSTFGHQILGNMLANELLLIS